LFNKQAAKTRLLLIKKAEDYMDQYELERAYECVRQALDLDGKNVDSLNMMASIQMEMGNCASAKSLYTKLVELQPNEGFSKYMCLAQLSQGQEAADFYKKGIELILIEYNHQQQSESQSSKPGTSAQLNAKSSQGDEEDEEDGQKIKSLDISTAYCSLAELYLTDLCMEDNADQTCKTFLDKSLEFDAKNPEALQLMASYWLSKEDLEQAKSSILCSVDQWMPKYVEASESGPMVDASQAITLTYDTRINTARILTEVQEYDKAADVLEQLLDEDDQVVVVSIAYLIIQWWTLNVFSMILR
jgi:Tfp pilus assembly protein PilF